MKKEAKVVRDALLELLTKPYAGDPKRRSGAELLALALLRDALNGSVSAAKEIMDRCEGKIVNQLEVSQPMDLTDAREKIELLVRSLREEGAPTNLLRLPSPSGKPQ